MTASDDNAARSRAGPLSERRASAIVPRTAGVVITLSVPGELTYRQLVLRVIESTCKLIRVRHDDPPPRSALDDAVVSACSEAFNNIAIHGYAETPGDVRIEIEPDDEGISIAIFDHGASFNPSQIVAPHLSELPESGMGLYIIRSFMDDVSYQPGRPPELPNQLRMYKRLELDAQPAIDPAKESSQ